MHGHPPYEVQFLKALGITVAVETVVLFSIIRRWFKLPRSTLPNALLFFSGVYCSSATLPYLWFVLPHFLEAYALFAIVGELAIFLIEATFYYFVLRLSINRSLLVSALCNLASVLVGYWTI